jgi:hypothetical protein
MTLAERYSTQCGLKIGKQFLIERFYPLENPKYILAQTGSGMVGKNYPYYAEVMELIGPILKANKIDVVQVGDIKDLLIPNAIDLRGKTSISQTNYLLARSMMLLGNDSFLQHRAGDINIPVVICMGPTDYSVHSAHFKHPNSIYISSHRWGKNPSFASQENPASIATIRPEEIANAVLKIFNVKAEIPRQSIFFGSIYNQQIIEWVPDAVIDANFLPKQAFIARHDYTDNSDSTNILYNVLQNRPLNILTDKELNIDILKQLKTNVSIINFEIKEDSNIEYVKSLKQSGLKVRFLSKEKDAEKLSNLRLKYFDITLIEQFFEKTKENFIEECGKYLNSPLDKNTTIFQDGMSWVRTNKFILSQGKIFLSKAAFKLNISTPSFQQNIMSVIDNEDFWVEMDSYYIFRQKFEQ